MRFKTVIVGGITNDPIPLRQFLQFLQAVLRVAQQRLFHQDMPFIGEQVGQNFRLGHVRRAHQSCLIRIERRLFDGLELRLRIERVNRGDEIGTRHFRPLLTLVAQTDDDDFHS